MVFSGWKNHYIPHVYVAIMEYLENHPEMAKTGIGIQMKEIMERAEAEYRSER